MPAGQQTSQPTKHGKNIMQETESWPQTWCGLKACPRGVANWKDKRSFWRWFADKETSFSPAKSNLNTSKIQHDMHISYMVLKHTSKW